MLNSETKQIGLDEKFFTAVREDLQKYSTDYDAAIERSKMLERQEQERLTNLHEAWEALNCLGPIVCPQERGG